jgi:competence ComEA-like helix-hairpin-helix protein
MRKATNFKIQFRDAALAIAVALSLLSFVAFLEAQKTPPAKPIDLNTASVEQLQQLPGVGPATAKAIVQFREKSGPFQRPENLLAIHGISPARFKKIKPYVIVVPPPKKPS